MIADLHCHTKLSDGSMSIDDLVYYAKRAGLDFVAITDHDTMDGVTRAVLLGKRYGISVIPATEVSCYDYARKRRVHILCYFPQKPDRLQGLFGQVLEARTQVGKRIIRDLKRYYPINEEFISRYTAGSKSIYKAHIMQALLELGYDCRSHGELYQKLFAGGTGLCAHEQEYPDVYEALETIHSAGALAVLAHPPVYNSLELLEELAEKGLLHGVEVHHPKVDEECRQELAGICDKYGLLQTGGSDFHGYLSDNPCPIASSIITEDLINALFAYRKILQKK